VAPLVKTVFPAMRTAGNVTGRKAAYNRCDYQTYGSHQGTAGPSE
jgi:hypothetical protein